MSERCFIFLKKVWPWEVIGLVACTHLHVLTAGPLGSDTKSKPTSLCPEAGIPRQGFLWKSFIRKYSQKRQAGCWQCETGKGRRSSECVTPNRVPQKIAVAQSDRGALETVWATPGKGAALHLSVSRWSRVAPGRCKFAGTFASVHVHREGGRQQPRGACPQKDTGAGCWEQKPLGLMCTKTVKGSRGYGRGSDKVC